MIGNPWFALLAFILGAGLTYLRMAGSATRQVAKPVPRRLVMGGIIPGLVDPPEVTLPAEIGPEWKIRTAAPQPEPAEAATVEEPDATAVRPADDPDADKAAAGEPMDDSPAAPEATEPQPEVQRLEPPWPTDEPVEALSPDAAAPDAPTPVAEPTPSSDPAPSSDLALSPEPAPRERQLAAGATDEPPTSSWWAAAFDRGDPGPYPGPLRYAGGWPPAGSRVLDVDDEFAAALGAGAAASAASAALFGTAHRHLSEAEPVRPDRQDWTPITVATPPERALSQDHPEVVETVGDDAVAAEPVTELIKGNRDSMLYHTPDSPWYARTNAEEWFHTEQEAQAAGYERWNSRIRNRKD
jgi:Predicted membrane protein